MNLADLFPNITEIQPKTGKLVNFNDLLSQSTSTIFKSTSPTNYIAAFFACDDSAGVQRFVNYKDGCNRLLFYDGSNYLGR